MKRVLRVGYPRYAGDYEFFRHIEFIKEYKNAFDEITLFTEFDHNGYREPSETLSTARILKKRIPVYRSLGFKSVGINILCTLGHLEEAYDSHEIAPFGYVVNRCGERSKSCICPSTKECLDYIRDRYSQFADCGADFIWIDDDVRLGNHGVVKQDDFCFCDGCISLFNSRYGTDFTRESIVSKWDNNEIKEQYTDMQKDILKSLYEAIRSAIHSKNPDIKIGVMNDASHMDTGAIISSGAVMGRPGGGFYNDQRPTSVYDKNFRIHSSIPYYPECVTDIQYEFESFPFESFEKSAHMTSLETALAIMAGCNGSLYSMGWFYDRPELAESLRRFGKKWDTLAEKNSGFSYTGVYCPNFADVMYLIESGIPVTHRPENASCAFLLGDDWNILSDSEIDRILSMGVYTDGRGAEVLTSRGFGDRLGCKVKDKYDNGMCERFTDHSVNGEYKGFFRNIFMNFPYKFDAYSLILEDGAEEVSRIETVTEKDMGSSLCLYETASGDRICVDGYMMPNKMKSKHKHRQLIGIFDYLSRDRMPIEIDKDIKVIPTVSSNGMGDLNIMLTNASLDSTGDLICTVNTEKPLYLINDDGTLTMLDSDVENGRSKIKISNIKPWDYTLITTNN